MLHCLATSLSQYENTNFPEGDIGSWEHEYVRYD
jgi:hypothetical protein